MTEQEQRSRALRPWSTAVLAVYAAIGGLIGHAIWAAVISVAVSYAIFCLDDFLNEKRKGG
jgi:hypothetical protein